MPKLVVVFYGRFQPPHIGHLETYNDLVKKFGKKNVYIGTSDKTDPDRSPLKFSVKKKMLANLGIPSDQIIQTRRNYNAGEIKEALGFKDFSDFIFVAAIGEKDESRLKGGKYLKELPRSKDELETADEAGYYYVRKGKMKSASDFRELLRKDKLSSKEMEALMKNLGLKKRGVMQLRKLIEHQLRKKSWHMILEGGAGGHVLHPFEDLTMTFGEMKELIEDAFEGRLSVKAQKGGGDVREKTDGQNLFASVINGETRFARNKTHLRNRGAASMDLKDIRTKWKNAPEVQAAFLDAGKTLEKGFEKLPSRVKEEIFGNGERWVNFEVISQKNPNVINYDRDLIVFHDIQIVDEKGNVTGVSSKATSKLYKIFSDAEKSAETDIPIQPPPFIRAEEDMNLDFSSKAPRFIGDIDKFKSSFGLNDKNTVADALEVAWNRRLDKVESKHAVNISDALRQKLLNRFVRKDKSYRITSLPKDLPDAGAIDAVKDLDKNSSDINKEILKHLELTILRFGTELLKSMKKFLTASPEKTAEKIRRDIENQIAAIRSSDNAEDIAKMEKLLQKIEAVGGFDSLVPTEGLVYRYKGKIYKITGLFAPVNQLMGLGRFGR